ncbi:hypothetical protein WN48_06725 [Eufriesea mexicana]|uniref:Uncharacterized protein n=1 Tax=Eufriesea mexicana TaxID=516756 RepID=A0A310SL75_9HYME|nr:hypothetical protein WN48_06725 [Eufriesea mexicana]
MFGQSSPVSDLCSFQSPGSSDKRLVVAARETIFQLHNPSSGIVPLRKHARVDERYNHAIMHAKSKLIRILSASRLYIQGTYIC